MRKAARGISVASFGMQKYEYDLQSLIKETIIKRK